MTSDTAIGNHVDAEFWGRARAKAPHVAKRIAYEYPGIDTDDIEQEIYLHLAENISTVRSYNNAALEMAMKTGGKAYADRERMAYTYQSAEWIYTPNEVRALFEEAYFDAGMWENAPQKETGEFMITAKNITVSLWDIDTAFEALSVDDQVAIKSRYEYGIPFADDSERKRVNRAIDRVTMKINGRISAKQNNP